MTCEIIRRSGTSSCCCRLQGGFHRQSSQTQPLSAVPPLVGHVARAEPRPAHQSPCGQSGGSRFSRFPQTAAAARDACQNRFGSARGGQVRRRRSRASADTCGSALIRAQTAVSGSTAREKVSGLLVFFVAASQLVPVTFDYAERRANADTRVDGRRVNSQSAVTLEPLRVQG